MNDKQQMLISGCATPSFIFIALNRWASGHQWWGAMWLVLAVVHAGMFIDLALRTRRAATHQPAAHASEGGDSK